LSIRLINFSSWLEGKHPARLSFIRQAGMIAASVISDPAAFA
jgi:hypothetical protein